MVTGRGSTGRTVSSPGSIRSNSIGSQTPGHQRVRCLWEPPISFRKQGVLFDPPYKWELTVLNVEREPAYDYRISGEKVLLPDQESIVVEAQIKAIGSGQLGDDYGLFSYVACTGSVGYGSSSRCYRRASLSPFVLVMQNGEEGKRRNHETFGLPAGATKTVRLAWYIWREQEAVLAIRMASGQRELSAYTGIFALR